MGKNYSIQDLVSFNISHLLRRYEEREEPVNMGGNNFGDDFINHIVERNGPELTRVSGFTFLGDENKERGIDR